MTPDEEVAERVRVEDAEQFNTLVRMHLSFVLDLNADEYDNLNDRRYKPLKWNLPFTKKTKSGCKLVDGTHLTEDLAKQISILIDFLSLDDSISTEGIFRRTGKLRRQQLLKTKLTTGEAVDLRNGEFSVHDCASVFKTILSELPEPLLTDAYYPAYCQAAELCSNENRLLLALQLLTLLIPSENRAFLRQILRLLRLATQHESTNRMSATNLATLFTPHLLCPRRLSPEALHTQSQMLMRVVSFMILRVDDVFMVPERLATDLRVYCEKKERRRRSPYRQMNESVCDGTTVNTVFTFVDRERTAQENGSNPTELALAQLYAHIQSLPDSAMKRRLVKNFNKKNGQGTPAVRSEDRNKHRRSKSLKDSIKKHLAGFGKNTKELSESPPTSPLKTPRHPPAPKAQRRPPQLKQELLSIGGNRFAKENIAPLVNIPRSKSCDALNSSGGEEPHSKPSASSPPLAFKHQTDQQTYINPKPSLSPSPPLLTSNRLYSSRIVLPRSAKLSPPTVTSLAKALIPTSPPAMTSERHVRRSNYHTRSSKSNISIRHYPSSNLPVKSPAFLPNCSDIDSALRSPKTGKRSSSERLELGRPPKRPSPDLLPINAAFCTPISSRRFPDATSTPAPRSACLLTPQVDRNSSMSPITRSAQRMPLAMQETMMTPRSRKPVVSLSGTDLCLNSLEPWTTLDAGKIKLPTTLILEESEGSANANSSPGQDSLSTTFRDYLYSRSVLTPSPVDLSFSSRTDDYQSLSGKSTSLDDLQNFAEAGPMSKSLLYCLDGNDPEENEVCSPSPRVCETAI